MLPCVCIVGKPNVGKSTLFNRLCNRRIAITDSTAGVTRDNISAVTVLHGMSIQCVDTGGIGLGDAALGAVVQLRSKNIMQSADLLLLVVDIGGITAEDEEVLQFVRMQNKRVILVVNKVDNDERQLMASVFYELGFSYTMIISASHGKGITALKQQMYQELCGNAAAKKDVSSTRHGSADESDTIADDNIGLAILGKQNTGKSLLLNYLVQKEHSLVSPIAGSTRDVVEAAFTFQDYRFRVLDTAGIRKRARVKEAVEYYSVQRAIHAVNEAELTILMIDATRELTEQDKKIASHIVKRGRGVVIALNKWDLVSKDKNRQNAMEDRIRFFFPVLYHVPIVPISALTGYGVSSLLKLLVCVRKELYTQISTAVLNKAMKCWILQTPPPSGKRPVKLKYITQVSTNPVKFLLFVNRKNAFPEFYERYLKNQIRRDFHLRYIPFFLEVRET